MTNKISAKFFEIFRNLKSDAVPRPPRQSQSFSGPVSPPTESFNESVNNSYQQEDEFGKKKHSKKKDKKTKYKKSFSTPSSNTPEFEENEPSNNGGSNVNTQGRLKLRILFFKCRIL